MIATVTGDAGEGRRVSMVLGVPPTPADLSRLAAVAAMPGLAGATWTVTPGGLRG